MVDSPQGSLHSYRFEQPTAHYDSSFLLLSLHDHFSFNRASFASEVTPTAARACSTVTPEFHEKIGCTVYDLRHFSESRCDVHIADQFYEPFHAIEVTSADLIITR